MEVFLYENKRSQIWKKSKGITGNPQSNTEKVGGRTTYVKTGNFSMGKRNGKALLKNVSSDRFQPTETAGNLLVRRKEH